MMMEPQEIVQESLDSILGPSFIDSPNFTPPSNTITPLTQFSSSSIIDIKKDFLNISLPFGCCISPFATPKNPLPIFRKSISTCVDCHALINCYSKVIEEDSKLKWNCIFCGKLNLFPPMVRDIKEFRRSELPDLYVQEFDYIDPINQPIYNVSQHFDQTMIFIIDSNITQSEMNNLRNAISQSLDNIPEKTNISIITFTSVVQIFELGLSGISSCEIYSGSRSPTESEIESIKNKSSRFLIPLKLCRNNIKGIFDYLIHSAKRDQVPSRSTVQHRCFGAAVQLALHLIQLEKGKEVHGRIENSAGGQIISFLNGFPNRGPGSFDTNEKVGEEYTNEEAELFYKDQAKICFKYNMSMNLFCIGLRNFRVKQLQSLVLNNGGSIVLFKDYNDPNLYDSLVKVMTSHIGRNGLFTIHSSTDITIGHIIGPAVSSQSIVNEEGDSTTLCVTSSVNPRHSFAIYFKLRGNIVYDHVYFQFLIKFANHRNEIVSRVFTYKIIATRSRATYLNNINEDISIVLLSKKYILKARKTPQNKARALLTELDKTLGQILKNTTDLRNKDTLYGITPTLANLPKLVYLLRRSPMLGTILQQSDEIDYLRCLFLQCDVPVARRLIEPLLFLVEEDSIRQLPLENLVLQSHHVLLLDHQTNIFIWYGSDAVERFKGLKNKCEEIAAELSLDRFPKPSIMTFKEGTSMARWLEARLIPSHKDTKSQQIYSYPDFGELSEIERTKLLSKFYHTDEVTFFQYMNTLQRQYKF